MLGFYTHSCTFLFENKRKDRGCTGKSASLLGNNRCFFAGKPACIGKLVTLSGSIQKNDIRV